MISKEAFYNLSDELFSSLYEGEDLVLSLNSEDTMFMRFSQSRVRQIGEVEQSDLKLEFSCDQKKISSSMSFQDNFSVNELNNVLDQLRKELALLPKDPHFTPIQGGHNTEEVILGELLPNDKVVDIILAPLDQVDAAGIYCSGKVLRASANSKGQRHWFLNDSFFIDYSLYSAKQQAVKGGYAGRVFEKKKYLEEIEDKKKLLEKVSNEARKITPGKYRTYFAPAAVAEFLGTMSWRGFSCSELKQGVSPLKDLVNGKRLSAKVHLDEDYSLGFSPRFNEQGEVAREKLTLFKEGRLINTLVSSRTAKEYGEESNFATHDETARSLSLSPGDVDEKDILNKLGTGLYISNLHYLNWSDIQKGRITGMTRFACFWVENAKIIAPIEDLRFDESFYHFFGDALVDLTKNAQVFPEIGTYEERSMGAVRTPGILVEDFSFTL